MKKFTNYAPGPRGITLIPADKNGRHEIVWIDPGQTVEVDVKRIVEPLPDLGEKPPVADPDEADRVEALTLERDELKEQVADQAKQIESLTSDLEKATSGK